MKIDEMTVQVSYSEDLQTSLMMAAVRLRDAVEDAALRHEPEIVLAAKRLDDVIRGVVEKMEIAAVEGPERDEPHAR